MEKELKKVTEKILANNIDGLRKELKNDDLFFFYKDVILLCMQEMAKYQKKSLYTEDEVKIILDKTLIEYSDKTLSDIPHWFKKFSKNK